jgi:hypothetical protein
MADDGYVEPLSGEEIIIDLCEQIAAKLRGDCNLRGSDAYAGGYSAKVSVHLELYGMDTVAVDAEIASGKPQEKADQVISSVLEVPVEPALDQVRERSEQPVPTLIVDTAGQPMDVRPRRYVRRDRVVGAATGEKL